jgi:hypothetical protein
LTEPTGPFLNRCLAPFYTGVDNIVKSAFSGRAVDLSRPFPMTIRRALVNGTPRIELVGAPSQQIPWLKSIGCFTEVIQYRTRVFLPVPTATEILTCVMSAGG